MTYTASIVVDEEESLEEQIADSARSAINTAFMRRMRCGRISISMEMEELFDDTPTEEIPSEIKYDRIKASLGLFVVPRGSTVTPPESA